MTYQDALASARPDVQAFADRLRRTVDAHGWSTDPVENGVGLRLLTEDGLYICRFDPTLEIVEVDLRRFRRRGLNDIADDAVRRLRALTGKDLSERSLQVPLSAIDRRWDDFFDVFLRLYIAAVRYAELWGPDPGHAKG